ncbi:glycosyltransferase [Azospirillum sp.]|uniref:glycosyltransferase n=1 Tax=Azospirillum sp. TaxID=34012 RepID=UPI002D5BB874|nr:glycosyltransferase [Azospirillum sp.]HYD63868.1 glycosyltransferase [Azospirillum sp.]
MHGKVADILAATGPAATPREAWRRLLGAVPAFSEGLPAPLTGAMLAIWLARPDLQALYPLDTEDGRRAFVLWCSLSGRREYRILEESYNAETSGLSRPAAGVPADRCGPLVSELMHHLHRSRPDLQRVFDLATPDGRMRYLGWFLMSGRAEVGDEGPLPPWQADLIRRPCTEVAQDQVVPISWGMVLLRAARPDLIAAFDLATPEGREAYVRWFYLDGQPDLRLPGLPGEADAAVLARPVIGGAEPGADAAISLLGCWIWKAREDLQHAFSLATPDGRRAFAAWLAVEGPGQYGYDTALLFSPAPPRPAPAAARADGHRPGVNLLGYAFGELGIGEDVRMAARACEAAALPFGVVNFAPGAEVRQQDTSLSAHVRPGFDHAANVLCMTGFETVRAFAQLGTAPFAGRYTIGYWPWELPEWPDAWRVAFDVVDEVWVSSRYTQAAYELVSPVPVVHMPMAVTVDLPRRPPRSAFGLPEDRFLFVFAFDGLSYLARKNPLAAVHAFRRAFPRGSEPVGLVIKAMNVAGRPEWEYLCAEAERDPRIVLIPRTLDRAGVLGLYAACDAFVSLHRAEGFGRGLAEAMLLEKPVVATAFSGNLEFCHPHTACLVGYRTVPLEPGDYPCGEGQSWADPDVDEAAAHMAALAADPARARALGRAARAYVEAHHAPAVVGARYRRRLAALGLLGG